jgi:hypothetical protein
VFNYVSANNVSLEREREPDVIFDQIRKERVILVAAYERHFIKFSSLLTLHLHPMLLTQPASQENAYISMAARNETAQPSQATPNTISLSELLSKLSCDSTTAGRSAQDQDDAQEADIDARKDALSAQIADLIRHVTSTKLDANDFRAGENPDMEAQLAAVEAHCKLGQRFVELHMDNFNIKRDETEAKIKALTELQDQTIQILLAQGASRRSWTNEGIVRLVKTMGMAHRADLDAMVNLTEHM